MGLMSRLQAHIEKQQENQKKKEIERLSRTRYFPLRNFEITLDDLELTPIGGDKAIVEWEGDEIGVINCSLSEEEIENAEEITLVLHDGSLCVAFVPEEDEEQEEEQEVDEEEEEEEEEEDGEEEEKQENEEAGSNTGLSASAARPVLRRRCLQDSDRAVISSDEQSGQTGIEEHEAD